MLVIASLIQGVIDLLLPGLISYFVRRVLQFTTGWLWTFSGDFSVTIEPGFCQGQRKEIWHLRQFGRRVEGQIDGVTSANERWSFAGAVEISDLTGTFRPARFRDMNSGTIGSVYIALGQSASDVQNRIYRGRYTRKRGADLQTFPFKMERKRR